MSTRNQDLSPQLALDLLHKGKIARARRLCDSGLLQDPDSDAWLHVHGLTLIEEGELASAEATLHRAIARNRSVAPYHHALGNALHSLGKVDRAITSYRRALRLDPQLAEAHNDLGTAFFDKHWLKEAEASFRESVRLKPGHEAALSNLGATLRAQGRIKEARIIFQQVLGLRIRRASRRLLPFLGHGAPKTVERAEAPPSGPQPAMGTPAPAIESDKTVASAIRTMIDAGDFDAAIVAAQQRVEANPSDAELHHVLGQALYAAGKDAIAIEHYSRAISIAPNMPRFHVNLGIVYQKQGLFQEAATCYRRAIQLDATLALAYNNLAAVLRDLDRFDLALEACQAAIRLDPAMAQAHGSMGEALTMLGRFDEARVAFERAVELLPQHIESWLGFGRLCLSHIDDLNQAESCFQRALILAPNNDGVHHGLGLVAQFRGRFAEAHRHFRHSQRLSLNAVHANFAESNLSLLEGDFEKGWALYHWRLGFNSQSHSNRKTGTPVWDGSPIAGRSILIYGEQGLGDEIMFASCIREIIDGGSRTVVACQPKLAQLFGASFPDAKVIPMDPDWDLPWIKNPATTDLMAAMGDVPRHLRPDAASFPKHSGYLKADPQRTAFWSAKLRELGTGKKIGISWMGGTKKTWRSLRSMQLDQLMPILTRPDTHFINLQYGDSIDQLTDFSARTGIVVHHWPEAIHDYKETSALVTALDLTVSVCTSIVHLAGALGRPVWVMAPQVPEWRYGHQGPGMIWYPSARVYRQPARGDWTSVIQRVADDLSLLR